LLHRSAVLPQLSTWKNQVGAVAIDFKFPGTCPVYCHRRSQLPLTKNIDRKTLLVVTNAVVKL